eukprot:sb/3463451/
MATFEIRIKVQSDKVKSLLENLQRVLDDPKSMTCGECLLEVVDRRVMPLLFEHTLASPFLGITEMTPFNHSSGTFSSLQTPPNRSTRGPTRPDEPYRSLPLKLLHEKAEDHPHQDPQKRSKNLKTIKNYLLQVTTTNTQSALACLRQAHKGLSQSDIAGTREESPFPPNFAWNYHLDPVKTYKTPDTNRVPWTLVEAIKDPTGTFLGRESWTEDEVNYTLRHSDRYEVAHFKSPQNVAPHVGIDYLKFYVVHGAPEGRSTSTKAPSQTTGCSINPIGKVRFKRLDLRFLEIGESQVKSFETHFTNWCLHLFIFRPILAATPRLLTTLECAAIPSFGMRCNPLMRASPQRGPAAFANPLVLRATGVVHSHGAPEGRSTSTKAPSQTTGCFTEKRSCKVHVLPRLILVSSSIVDGSIWTTETMILLQEINHTTVTQPVVWLGALVEVDRPSGAPCVVDESFSILAHALVIKKTSNYNSIGPRSELSGQGVGQMANDKNLEKEIIYSRMSWNPKALVEVEGEKPYDRRIRMDFKIRKTFLAFTSFWHVLDINFFSCPGDVFSTHVLKRSFRV